MQTYITHNLQTPTSGAQAKYNCASKLACKAQLCFGCIARQRAMSMERSGMRMETARERERKEKGAQTKHNSACKLACKAQLCFGCIARQRVMSMERSGMRMETAGGREKKKPKYKLRYFGFFFYRTDA